MRKYINKKFFFLPGFILDQSIPGLIIIAALLIVIATAGCVTVNLNVPAMTSPSSSQASPVGTTVSSPSYGYSAGVNATSPNSTQYASSQYSVKTLTPTTRATLNPDSKSDVNKRFQEVVFGNEAQYLNRWEKRCVKLGIAGEYTMEDVDTLKNFVLRFNNESETTKLTEPYQSESQEFTVRLVPQSFFDALDEDKADKVEKTLRQERSSLQT